MSAEAIATLVQEKLDGYIRPNLHMHGGDMLLESVENGVVTLEMVGTCGACAFRPNTYAGIVRPALMQLDGVVDVKVTGVRMSRFALDRIDASSRREAS